MSQKSIGPKSARKSVEAYNFYKTQGESFENEAKFHWLSFKTWSEEGHKLFDQIRVKLKAVQKYQTPQNQEKPTILIDKKQYMKYGPSDEED